MPENPPEEIIVPDQAAYAYRPAKQQRRYSPGLLGLAERLPGVHTPQAASRVLLAAAVVLIGVTLFVLKSVVQPSAAPVTSTDGTVGGVPLDR